MAPQNAAASHDPGPALPRTLLASTRTRPLRSMARLTPQAFSSARTAGRGGFLAFFGAGAAFMVVCCVADDR